MPGGEFLKNLQKYWVGWRVVDENSTQHFMAWNYSQRWAQIAYVLLGSPQETDRQYMVWGVFLKGCLTRSMFWLE